MQPNSSTNPGLITRVTNAFSNPVQGGDFAYTREIVIDLPIAEVFQYLQLLANFRNWNPFFRKDTQVDIQSRGTDGQAGYTIIWNGKRDVGSGEQEIKKITANERIDFELRFKKPFAATNQAYFETKAVCPTQTLVRWTMKGKSAFPMNFIGIFLNFDKMIGAEFEWGLNQLKSILEKKAA